MTWESGKYYNVGDRVFVLNEWFMCLVSHKSDIFGNDFFDNKCWKREKLEKKVDLFPNKISMKIFSF